MCMGRRCIMFWRRRRKSRVGGGGMWELYVSLSFMLAPLTCYTPSHTPNPQSASGYKERAL